MHALLNFYRAGEQVRGGAPSAAAVVSSPRCELAAGQVSRVRAQRESVDSDAANPSPLWIALTQLRRPNARRLPSRLARPHSIECSSLTPSYTVRRSSQFCSAWTRLGAGFGFDCFGCQKQHGDHSRSHREWRTRSSSKQYRSACYRTRDEHTHLLGPLTSHSHFTSLLSFWLTCISLILFPSSHLLIGILSVAISDSYSSFSSCKCVLNVCACTWFEIISPVFYGIIPIVNIYNFESFSSRQVLLYFWRMHVFGFWRRVPSMETCCTCSIQSEKSGNSHERLGPLECQSKQRHLLSLFE